MKLDVSSIWYRKSLHPLSLILLPLSWFFGICSAMRRFFYRCGIFTTHRFNVPVIVVGNITVGGTGKTPLVIALAKFLQSQGYQPGIVSRGIGGKKQQIPYCVKADDLASIVGDEALLLRQNTNCPVVIGINRAAAVRELLKNFNCNIVISDDGLQHYSLGREIEIVMIDGDRGLGNHQLLPAGPLRERKSRLKKTHFVVVHGSNKKEKYTMQLQPREFISVVNPEHKINFADFPTRKIHAVAGIGNPQRFFSVLHQAEFELTTHAFPDHHLYQPKDLDFAETLPILMTEKDAVKCAAFADERYWYLKVDVVMNKLFEENLLIKLRGNNHEI